MIDHAQNAAAATPTFQQIIGRLQEFWAEQGCIIWQPHHTEVGAGTFNPATFLAGGPIPGGSPTSSPPSVPPTDATARTPTGWATTTSIR